MYVLYARNIDSMVNGLHTYFAKPLTQLIFFLVCSRHLNAPCQFFFQHPIVPTDIPVDTTYNYPTSLPMSNLNDLNHVPSTNIYQYPTCLPNTFY